MVCGLWFVVAVVVENTAVVLVVGMVKVTAGCGNCGGCGCACDRTPWGSCGDRGGCGTYCGISRDCDIEK